MADSPIEGSNYTLQDCIIAVHGLMGARYGAQANHSGDLANDRECASKKLLSLVSKRTISIVSLRPMRFYGESTYIEKRKANV